MIKPTLLIALCLSLCCHYAAAKEPINIGLNYPKTRAYQAEGLAQMRGALMARDEINAAGGILGHPIELITMNTASKVDRSVANVKKLATNHNVKMIFGGSSSAVAIAASQEAKRHNLLYFGTLTYSNDTTGKDGHTHMFRESNSAWMAAKALAHYLNKQHSGAKYFYITADYTWGWSTEKSMRQFTYTTDSNTHPSVLMKFPAPSFGDFRAALAQAEQSGATVLVLSQFGGDMANALKIASQMGLKKKMQIVVPSLTLAMAEQAGASAMQGVIGSLPWTWQVPQQYNYATGKDFVAAFSDRYQAYPSTSAASAYSILYQYKDAVERAKSFNTQKVIQALEGHRYSLLKDEQIWRDFDHQNEQTVYVVRGKSRDDVIADKYRADFFEIIDSMSGKSAVPTRGEWNQVRREAGKPEKLL